MNKGKKFFGKRKKGGFKSNVNKRKVGLTSREGINKKAIFNRYKNKQKVEEEKAKKMLMERKLQQEQSKYSESEEEEDVYGQLLSCFTGSSQKNVDSGEDSESGDESADLVTMDDCEENMNQDDKENFEKDEDLSEGIQEVFSSTIGYLTKFL